MNNGINISLIGWQTVDFVERVDLGGGSIIVLVFSFWWTLRSAIISMYV